METETMFATDTPILVYHRITADIPPANLDVLSLSQFKQQMSYLQENGYVCLSLTDILRSSGTRPSRRKTFALTFDDGYEDFFTLAYPILRDCGFTATVFVITDKIFMPKDPKRGADKRYLNDEQIKFLHEHNISFGSHTCSHPMLTKLSSDEIRRELVHSKASMEATLGQKIDWLAYPHGASNSEIKNMARECGYRAAFGGSHARNSLFNIRRQFCFREESLISFAFRLNRFFHIFERFRNETEMGHFLRKVKNAIGLPGILK